MRRVLRPRQRLEAAPQWRAQRIAASEIRPDHQIVAHEVVDGGAPEADQALVDAGAKDPEDIRHAGLAARCQAPQVRSADQDGAGPDGKRLHDVASAPDSAVEQYLDLVAHRVDD